MTTLNHKFGERATNFVSARSERPAMASVFQAWHIAEHSSWEGHTCRVRLKQGNNVIC